jgi:hypothetical protein
MKQKLQITLLLTALTISFFSCKKSDEKPANKFTYDSKTYALKSGTVDLDTDDQDDDPLYYHNVILYTGLTIENHDFTGTGNVISFDIASATGSVEAGVYNFDDVEANYKAGDLTGLSVFINYNTSAKTGDRYELTAGTATITKSGETYTIDITGTANSKAITIHFSGLLPTL